MTSTSKNNVRKIQPAASAVRGDAESLIFTPAGYYHNWGRGLGGRQMLLFKVTFNFSPPSIFFKLSFVCPLKEQSIQRGEAIFAPWLKFFLMTTWAAPSPALFVGLLWGRIVCNSSVYSFPPWMRQINCHGAWLVMVYSKLQPTLSCILSTS